MPSRNEPWQPVARAGIAGLDYFGRVPPPVRSIQRKRYRPMHYSPAENMGPRSVTILCLWVFLVSALAPVAPGQAEVVDRIVAIVNEDIILLSELDQAMVPYEKQLSREGMSELQQHVILEEQKKKVLDELIKERLTEQKVKDLGLRVDEDDITATIERIKQANNISDDQLNRMLELDGMTYEDYRAKIKQQLLQSRLLNVEVKSKIVITEEDAKAYYDAHSDQYKGQVKVHLRQILMNVPASATTEERQRVKQKMQQIHERLTGGEDFAQMAMVYSQASTASKGGDLGFFEMRHLAPQIREALQGLTVGQYTGIVETDQGYQLLYLQERKSVGGKPFSEAAPEIEQKLYTEIVEKKFQEWVKDLRQNAHIEIME